MAAVVFQPCERVPILGGSFFMQPAFKLLAVSAGTMKIPGIAFGTVYGFTMTVMCTKPTKITDWIANWVVASIHPSLTPLSIFVAQQHRNKA